MAKLNQATREVAIKLHEATVSLSQTDICRTLSAALSDLFEDDYCYVLDVFETEGQVVYYQGGATRKAPYTIATGTGKRTATINVDKAVNVLPRTVYDKVATESAGASADGVKLTEAASFTEEIRLKEATTTDYAVKLIAPGRGSSAYYPADVLERDGPKIFTSGTHMYWNHATAQQESQRPEGDLNELAAVLTSNAYYDGAGKEGAGLYARAKVFADYAEKVQEKAKYTGLSIRARGTMSEAKAPDGKPGMLARFTAAESVDFVTKAGAGGKVLTESGIVGEGIASELNLHQHREASEMDAAEVTKLVEAGVKLAVAPLLAENKKLSERLTITAEAPAVIAEYFTSVRVSPAIMERVTRRAMEAADRYMVEGKLDAAKFKTFIEAETKDEAAFIERATGGRVVIGMGTQAQTDPVKLAEAAKLEEKEHLDDMKRIGRMFIVESGDEKIDERKVNIFAQGREVA